MSLALRITIVVAWGVTLVALTAWSYTEAALVCAALATVLTGALVGRWWVLLVPLVIGLAYSLLIAISGVEDTGHGTGVEWAAFVFVPLTLLIVALMAVGVLLHHGATRLTGGHRSSPHPQS